MVCQASLAWELVRSRNRAASRPGRLSREHARAGLLSDGITDDQSALIAARWYLLVSVLETLQLQPVTLSEPAGSGLHVDVGHVTRAIREAGDRVEQSRTDDIADLETGMVDTVPEGRQLGQPLVARVMRSEFLCEDGVGHIHIQEFLAPVSNAHPRAMSGAQRVMEICADLLDRGRVDRLPIERRANALDPDPGHQFDIVGAQKPECAVQEANGMFPGARGVERTFAPLISCRIRSRCRGDGPRERENVFFRFRKSSVRGCTAVSSTNRPPMTRTG